MPNVQVAIRCRPPLDVERDIPSTKVEANEVANTVHISGKDQAKKFTFDKVFPETSSQDDVFNYVSPMVDHALDGLHSTVFAYGQTGSGKTFTMEGFDYTQDSHGRPKPLLNTPVSQHGVLPRVIQTIFDRTRERSSHNSSLQYKLKCSFMQLYNEKVMDLLNPATRNTKEGLKIRWTRDDCFKVDNLFTFECENAAQMREMFQMGVKEKIMGSHHMNIQSSRSHCLFTIHVHSWDPSAPDCVIKSDLTLVDLAGSEKLALLSNNPSAQLVKESIEINTSLLSLGKVITALAKDSKTHIPYRDSKLTKLLKHSLGGNAMTVMIACINPLDAYVEETLSTLMYAGRARNITNEPKINEDPRAALIRQLREEIAQLKLELEYFRQLATTGVVDERISQRFSSQQRPATSDPHIEVVHQPGAARPRPSSVPPTNGDTTHSQADEDLAEKLLQSCKMLKNMMQINGELRKAFDNLKEMKTQSDIREVELNAENSSLRERIEVLESITLSGGNQQDSNRRSVEADQRQHRLQQLRGRTGDSVAMSSSNPSQQHQPQQVAQSRQSNEGVRRSRSSVPPPPRDEESGEVSNFLVNPSAMHHALPTYSDQLRDYADKYKNPTKSNYEDYYGAARRSVSRNTQGSNHIVTEMERLLKKTPAATQQMIPTSLQSAQAFGSLAFGGAEDDKNSVEERRKRRQERMQQLQEQHNKMQKGWSGGDVSQSVTHLPSGSRDQQPPAASFATMRSSHPSMPSDSYNQVLNTPHQNSSSSSTGGSSTGKLFAYLSSDESQKTFTEDQLAKLRGRQQDPSRSGASASVAGSECTVNSGGYHHGGGVSSRHTPRNKTHLEAHKFSSGPVSSGGDSLPSHFQRQAEVHQQQKYQQQVYDAQLKLQQLRSGYK